jgi:hypothetical protein
MIMHLFLDLLFPFSHVFLGRVYVFTYAYRE